MEVEKYRLERNGKSEQGMRGRWDLLRMRKKVFIEVCSYASILKFCYDHSLSLMQLGTVEFNHVNDAANWNN